MKVLLLGAGGQVGRALAAALPAGIDLDARTRTQCDISDSWSVHSAIATARPDVVVNAAAYTKVDDAERHVEEAELLNGRAPGVIAEEARRAGGRTVQLSTDFVFDGRQTRPYRPSDATAPLSVYGRTKRDGELAAAAADPDALIVRSAWIHAASGANFVRTILRLAAERDVISVVSDQIGTPTSASSLARALWRLIAGDARGIYHYTDAGVASWYDFAVAVIEESRALGLIQREVEIRPIATSDFPTAAARPAFSVLDKTDTWALLGEAAPHWRTGVRKVLGEIKQHG